MTNPHSIEVTYVPLDAPGMRIAGSIPGEDQNLFELRDIADSLEENLKLTEGAMADPKTADLAKAVRGALLNIESLNQHILSMHRGFLLGNLNYPDGAPWEQI